MEIKNIELYCRLILKDRDTDEMCHYQLVSGLCVWIHDFPQREFLKRTKEITIKDTSKWFKERFNTDTSEGFDELFFEYIRDKSPFLRAFSNIISVFRQIEDEQKEKLSDPTLYIIAEQLEKLKSEHEKLTKQVVDLLVEKENVKEFPLKKIKHEKN